MSKGLKALENVRKNIIFPINNMNYDIEDYCNDTDTIEKELKALEIIKKKNVDIWDIKYSEDYEHYNLMTSAGTSKNHIYKPITKEEYELLKEVLL